MSLIDTYQDIMEQVMDFKVSGNRIFETKLNVLSIVTVKCIRDVEFNNYPNRSRTVE